jgi:hypothetical protein
MRTHPENLAAHEPDRHPVARRREAGAGAGAAHGLARHEEELGKDWPFVHITVGTVRRIPRPGTFGKVIFTADGDGRKFGLNGTALDAGYKDIPASEWRKNPDIPGAGVSVAPLRDPVAKACGL